MQLSMVLQIIKIWNNPRLNLKEYLDVNFHREQGADLGGPNREFFRTAISSHFMELTPFSPGILRRPVSLLQTV